MPRLTHTRLGLVLAAGLVVLWCLPAAAHRAVRPTQWNESSDPNALYGLCGSGGSGMGMRSVYLDGRGVRESLADVLKITVLKCGSWGGPGVDGKVPCPAGSPYNYCIQSTNDGGGNRFLWGILKADPVTEPYADYRGCPSGVATQAKINVLIDAKQDPRLISGIVTLRCKRATGTPRPARMVSCPSGPTPYAYCLWTPNDGRGTSVNLGVVASNGPLDTYGFYGECNTAIFGNRMGFKRKSTLVNAVGQDLAKAASVVVTTCRERSGGDVPLRLVSCNLYYFVTYQQLGWKFDYCIEGLDTLNNFVRAGVLTRP